MRYQRRASKLKLITEISITPLMDLVFILLFAFMVAVPLVTQTDRMRQSGTFDSKQPTTPPKAGETVTLAIAEDGNFRWNEQPTDFEAIPTVIQNAVNATPKLGVVIQIPTHRSAQELVRLMNLLDDLGVTRTAIQLITQPTSSAPGQ